MSLLLSLHLFAILSVISTAKMLDPSLKGAMQTIFIHPRLIRILLSAGPVG